MKNQFQHNTFCFEAITIYFGSLFSELKLTLTFLTFCAQFSLAGQVHFHFFCENV